MISTDKKSLKHSQVMKKVKIMRAEDLENDIELDPNESYNDFDVLVAVAKSLKGRFAGEKSQRSATATMEDEQTVGILNPLNLTIPKKVRGGGGVRFGMNQTPQYKYNSSPLDISKLETEMMMKMTSEKVCDEAVKSRVSRREEDVRSKRNAKRRIIFGDDGEQKVIHETNKRGRDRGEEHGISRPNKTIKSTKKEKIKLPDPSPDLPDEFKMRIANMGGRNIQLVITKMLESSDCRPDQQRLSMPTSKVAADFLEQSEKDDLDAKNAILVKLIQPNLQLKEIEINLKKWFMPKDNGRGTSLYVLTKPWNGVVKENGLVSGNIIQVWSFRMEEKLGLAIVRLPKGEELE